MTTIAFTRTIDVGNTGHGEPYPIEVFSEFESLLGEPMIYIRDPSLIDAGVPPDQAKLGLTIDEARELVAALYAAIDAVR